MCKVIDVRHKEDCFDGGFVKEFELDVPLDEAVMYRLAEAADLQYFPDFPRPYFCIREVEIGTLQGVLGNSAFRVTFTHSGRAKGVDWVTSRIERRSMPGV